MLMHINADASCNDNNHDNDHDTATEHAQFQDIQQCNMEPVIVTLMPPCRQKCKVNTLTTLLS